MCHLLCCSYRVDDWKSGFDAQYVGDQITSTACSRTHPALHQQFKRPKHESDRSTPPGVEVLEQLAITCIPLHVAHDVALN
jgi:hypothetical protein